MDPLRIAIDQISDEMGLHSRQMKQVHVTLYQSLSLHSEIRKVDVMQFFFHLY